MKTLVITAIASVLALGVSAQRAADGTITTKPAPAGKQAVRTTDTKRPMKAIDSTTPVDKRAETPTTNTVAPSNKTNPDGTPAKVNTVKPTQDAPRATGTGTMSKGTRINKAADATAPASPR